MANNTAAITVNRERSRGAPNILAEMSPTSAHHSSTSSLTSSPATTKSTLDKSVRRALFSARVVARTQLSPPRLRLIAIAIALLCAIISLFALPDSSSTSSSPLHHPGNAPSGLDACMVAASRPENLTQFDPSGHESAEFTHFDTTGPPRPPSRVFSSFFKSFLFDPASDVVENVTLAHAGVAVDIRLSRPLIQHALNAVFGAHGRVNIQCVPIGYSHLDRVRGSRLIMHVRARVSGKRAQRHVVVIQRTFDGKCRVGVVKVAQQSFEKPVYMVVPYSRRPRRLEWFLAQFDRLRGRGLQIVLVLAADAGDARDLAEARSLIGQLRFAASVLLAPVHGDSTGYFSRAVAIRDGTEYVPSDGLMFISDIDMQIFPPFFDSCRTNVQKGSQVYFPVFYTLFAGSKRIDKRGGYWRASSYGMSCMYKSDFIEVAAYRRAERKFIGWGSEDVALVNAFVRHEDYEVFRAVEPTLRHKWHAKHCEKYTAAYAACMGMAYDQLGTASSLGKTLLTKHGIDAQQLLSNLGEADDRHRNPASMEEALEDEERRKRRRIALKRIHEAKKRRRAEWLRREKENQELMRLKQERNMRKR